MSKYKARDFLQAIDGYREDNGYAPGVRDLQQVMGVSSTSVVQYWLKVCRERGYVDYKDGIARTLTITPEGISHLNEGSNNV